MTEALLAKVAGLAAEIGTVEALDAESFMVRLGSTSASVRVLALAEGLDVLAITQLIALDLPNTDELRRDIEDCGAQLSFGSLRRSDPDGVTTDVLQYYTFPVGELGDVPLLTVLHIVLSSGADAAARLVGG
ncbi:hypothetical protein Gbro_3151 [Gordonia bronchialis DSM 43247]|uniref:Sensory transduction regulator n=1 Tax=Gordonia bronchialis (strain ATCC 25592 / DSM 43247 / BCRC 13721 / JCM 3198 / KCTC 3076 / NBRC 16047 / NCTC 10667) TaxID=526226 RepID=D0LBW9_GORB4|nr:hypothetical protein [Gordonia bronchialis]ACY22356.1 hypothetical protein Gbro_3151 [Gordonia bronchialis DSM 43247]MCC3325143.1 perilipin family protein [Gordonia bronchialis]QGS24121.1 hypothetical protein FOB84_08020 [Gordonia bronchialis]UAK39696.1 perilipin family protein [Gordonia bronchialis]STQ65284.1 Uncharacterised protein [Gordonia bronchialis]